VTDNSHDVSFHNHFTQGIDDSFVPAADDTISSMLDFSRAALKKTIPNDVHVVKPEVQAGTAINQCDCMDECASITLVVYCLAQYISTLNVEHQKHMQSLLQSDTVHWISKLFR